MPILRAAIAVAVAEMKCTGAEGMHMLSHISFDVLELRALNMFEPRNAGLQSPVSTRWVHPKRYRVRLY